MTSDPIPTPPPSYGTLRVPGASLWYKARGRGPALLVLQGGGGTADASDGMASHLESALTVVSYDRRGLLRSPVDDAKRPLTIEQHAEDALALMDALELDRAMIFGSSLGALIGLELATRQPERVEVLVAHEPTAVALLPPEWQTRIAQIRKEVLEASLREGPRAGFRHLLAQMGVNRDDREHDCEPPASAREQSRDTGFLLLHESRAVDRWRLNRERLVPHAGRVVPAFGAGSRQFYPAACALALGDELGRGVVELPGGHNGHVLRPRAFAGALGDVLERARSGSSRPDGGRSGIPPATGGAAPPAARDLSA